MTGGSDDAPPPKDGRGAIDDAWDALIDEAGNEKARDEDAVQPNKRPVSGPLGAVGRDRLAEPDDEMARLMTAAPQPKPESKPPKIDPRALMALTSKSRPSTTPEFEPAGGKTKSAGAETKSAETKSAEAKAAEAEAKAAETKSAETKAAEAEAKAAEVKAAEAETKSAETRPADVDSKLEAAKPAGAGDAVEPTGTKSSTVSDRASESPKPPARGGRPALRVVDGSKDGSESPDEASPSARASRPAEPAASAPSSPPPSSGLPWGWIGAGVVALAAVALFAIPETTPPSEDLQAKKPSAQVASPEPTKAPPKTLASTPTPDSSGGEDEGSGQPPTAGDTAGSTAPPPVRSGDPREPPPGTPEEIAAVFRRLPVSPSDGPPIGGIGASGVHIDKLEMGTGSACTGPADDFSVSGLDRVVVCVRVVHPREKEELVVLWQKHGGSTRRSKMVVLPKHAYRTRGYLKLRREYIGDWTVRILSSDGVELAQHEFKVVP